MKHLRDDATELSDAWELLEDGSPISSDLVRYSVIYYMFIHTVFSDRHG